MWKTWTSRSLRLAYGEVSVLYVRQTAHQQQRRLSYPLLQNVLWPICSANRCKCTAVSINVSRVWLVSVLLHWQSVNLRARRRWKQPLFIRFTFIIYRVSALLCIIYLSNKHYSSLLILTLCMHVCVCVCVDIHTVVFIDKTQKMVWSGPHLHY